VWRAGVFLWAHILQTAGHFTVHVADDLDAPLMLFLGDHGPQDGLELLGELNDVHLVGDHRVLAWPVALEKDLLDQLFIQVHFLPSMFPS
jgi:hypothetical protein